MKTTAWKDTSHWSQSDKDRSVPNEWTLQGDGIRIVLHHYVGHGKAWFVTCYDVHIERNYIGEVGIEVAKVAAEQVVVQRLRRMLDSLVNTDPRSKP